MVGLYVLQRKLVVCNHKSPLYFAAEIIRTKSLVPKIKDVEVAASLQAGPVFLPFTTERSWVLTTSSPNTAPPPKACWHGHVNFSDSCLPVCFLGSCSSYGLWVHPGPQARKVLQSQGPPMFNWLYLFWNNLPSSNPLISAQPAFAGQRSITRTRLRVSLRSLPKTQSSAYFPTNIGDTRRWYLLSPGRYDGIFCIFQLVGTWYLAPSLWTHERLQFQPSTSKHDLTQCLNGAETREA